MDVTNYRGINTDVSKFSILLKKLDYEETHSGLENIIDYLSSNDVISFTDK